MSLLKDGEILAALNKAWGNDTVESINDVECGDRAIAEAQRTQTLKAVAEWLLENCGWDGHGNRLIYFDFNNSKDKRQLCNWLAGMFEGKMPGEE
ncbi:hypothetical protein LCGC14_0972070 [marine sediment metagenome]|uniref:Uncharacterized protein n=1 Tax=marine sediment metagenome TaxID=412755 RepID=A0A0F9NXM6_9ZZZZ